MSLFDSVEYKVEIGHSPLATKGIFEAVDTTGQGTNYVRFSCPCANETHEFGSSKTLMLPVNGTNSSWRFTVDENGKPTLDPSVKVMLKDSSDGCHFYLRNGDVQWV